MKFISLFRRAAAVVVAAAAVGVGIGSAGGIGINLGFEHAAWADDGGPEADRDAPRVGASLDRTEAHVGDRLTLTVSAIARGEQAATVRLPDKLDLGKFELLDSSTSDRDLGDGNKSRRFVLQIAAYETGEHELPPITLSYKNAAGQERTVETTSIPVVVKSVVDDPRGELQPLKAQRQVMIQDRRIFTGLKWAGAGAAALLVLALLRVVLRRRARAVVAVAEPPRPADEVALEKLAALRAAGDFGADGYRPFHFALSEVVRAYLGARYALDAAPSLSSGSERPAGSGLELTTTELAAALDAIAVSDGALDRQRLPIRELLERCDLVKFAKAPSSDAESLAALDAAEAIVRATRPLPVAAEAPAPQAEAAR